MTTTNAPDVEAAIAVFDKSASRTTPNAQTAAWAVLRAHLSRLEAQSDDRCVRYACKRREVEMQARIESLEDQLAQARADGDQRTVLTTKTGGLTMRGRAVVDAIVLLDVKSDHDLLGADGVAAAALLSRELKAAMSREHSAAINRTTP